MITYSGVPYKHTGMLVYFGQKCRVVLLLFWDYLTITLLLINEIQIFFLLSTILTMQELQFDYNFNALWHFFQFLERGTLISFWKFCRVVLSFFLGGVLLLGTLEYIIYSEWLLVAYDRVGLASVLLVAFEQSKVRPNVGTCVSCRVTSRQGSLFDNWVSRKAGSRHWLWNMTRCYLFYFLRLTCCLFLFSNFYLPCPTFFWVYIRKPPSFRKYSTSTLFHVNLLLETDLIFIWSLAILQIYTQVTIFHLITLLK